MRGMMKEGLSAASGDTPHIGITKLLLTHGAEVNVRADKGWTAVIKATGGEDEALQGVLPAQTLVRTNKYLNNMIEQDHRKAPQRCYSMLRFKTFGSFVIIMNNSLPKRRAGNQIS